jgi:predicted Zn-dependent protease
MRNEIKFVLVLAVSVIASQGTYAQEEPSKIIKEEESAEVFLEEYTDEFQEKFFDALKQKGIQNYDRAVNLLLECKRLEPENNVLNHELAKAYLLDKKYIPAQQYAIEALVSEPKNYWYLETLMTVLDKQSSSMEEVKLRIPFSDVDLKKNLALIYFRREAYQESLKMLEALPKSTFKENLVSRIDDAENSAKKFTTVKSTGAIVVASEPTSKGLEMNLKNQIRLEQFRAVEITAKNAVEAYPLQPYFYYAYGLSLHKNNKNREAIAVLESSLDYLFDDISLANKIYKTLADAYTKLSNFSKANLYLSKVKPGF